MREALQRRASSPALSKELALVIKGSKEVGGQQGKQPKRSRSGSKNGSEVSKKPSKPTSTVNTPISPPQTPVCPQLPSYGFEPKNESRVSVPDRYSFLQIDSTDFGFAPAVVKMRESNLDRVMANSDVESSSRSADETQNGEGGDKDSEEDHGGTYCVLKKMCPPVFCVTGYAETVLHQVSGFSIGPNGL